MKKVSTIALLAIGLVSIFSACQDDDFNIQPQKKNLVLPANVLDYEEVVDLPSHFTDDLRNGSIQDNTPSFNSITNHGATLGRVLFYDTKLSLNSVKSCASCHHQENGFADPVAFSEGFNNKFTSRNSMAIFNNRFSSSFFWDMEVKDLEDQVVMPIKDHIEMGIEDLNQLESKLAKVDYYPELFKNAFGSSEITAARISLAMSQFIRSIVSYDSKYDKGVASNFTNFTSQERLGFEVFKSAECDNCHSSQNFGGIESANIGLEMTYADKGRGAIENREDLNGVFKVPSLRNIELTAPYMHDGRFQTLEQVVDHYSEAIVNHRNLDLRLTAQGNSWNDTRPSTSNIMHFEFTEEESHALVAFLKTLTDENMMKDEKYADPFH